MTLARASLLPLLREMVCRRAGTSGTQWFEQVQAAVSPPGDHELCMSAFTRAARRVGKARLNATADEAGELARLGLSWPIGDWGLDELARVTVLVLVAEQAPAGELDRLLEECYRQGDSRERQAVLRALPLLPEPERFLSIAVDACRTHIQPLFEAIACENPYPAAHFPDLNFNQLVLKALFIGVALGRIVDLSRRITPELIQMAQDYASERKAAGRSVPDDIWTLTGEKEARP